MLVLAVRVTFIRELHNLPLGLYNRFTMSLRLRLTLLYAFLTAGILILLGFSIYGLVWNQLIHQTDQMLADVAQDILHNTYTGPAGKLQVLFLPDLRWSAHVYIQFWDADGILVSASPNIATLDTPLDPTALQATQAIRRSVYTHGAHLRVLSTPVSRGNYRLGVLQVGASLMGVDQARLALSRIFTMATIIAVLLTSLISWTGVGKALAPLRNLMETASQINRADDLSRRIAYNGPPDEIGRLVAAFNETLERLERLFTSQQRFLADVSHELRTPLTVIKGNADLMRRMKEADEESLRSIEEEADRLTRLVGDLLLEAQAESGRLPLRFAPLELDTLLLDVYHEMNVLARGRVTLKLSEIDQVQMVGDRDRLKQVLVNVISNAINYTPEGGEVYLSLGRVGEQARLIVRDTGPGIPAEDLPHIFERFYRAAKERPRAQSGGFGLGLSIAHWIVLHHGGRIEVKSQEGQGTTFCIWLPLSRPDSQEEETE